MENGQINRSFAGSQEVRTRFRELLNAVEFNDEHITVLRYATPTAVVVPIRWYERAQQALGEEQGNVAHIPDR